MATDKSKILQRDLVSSDTGMDFTTPDHVLSAPQDTVSPAFTVNPQMSGVLQVPTTYIVQPRSLGYTPPVPPTSLRSLGNAYVIWFPLGLFGAHHYYLKNPWMGVAYTFTLGLFGIGWLLDVLRMPMLVNDINKEIEAKWIWQHEGAIATPYRPFDYKQPKRISDSYLLGFTTGFLGLHHHYLGNHCRGVLYLFTLGLFGIGWVSDWFLMPCHVQRCNNREAAKQSGVQLPKQYYLDVAYVMAFPGGLLGFHNFYLGRIAWGVLYMFTAGMFGVGWLIDMVRMPCLVQDANMREQLKNPIGEENPHYYQSTDATTVPSAMLRPPLPYDQHSAFQSDMQPVDTVLPPAYAPRAQPGSELPSAHVFADGDKSYRGM